MSCPLDYSLCDQTVTVYRMYHGRLTRRVLNNALLTVSFSETNQVPGQEFTVHCHVILPGEDADLWPGDRILHGIGPSITTEQWFDFVPVKVPGLAQIDVVKPFYWQGIQCHIEGGG